MLLAGAFFLIACAKGGGGDSAVVSQSGGVSGTYIDSFKNETTGDCYVASYSFNAGKIETYTYYFKGCGQSAAFLKFTGTYFQIGNVYSPTYAYQTCAPPNGLSEAYTITPAGPGSVSIDISYSQPINGISNLQLVGTQETTLNSFLNSIGMIAAVEDTGCTLVPGD